MGKIIVNLTMVKVCGKMFLMIPPQKRVFASKMRRNPTRAEAYLWKFLRGKKIGYRFHRQNYRYGFILDFYCCPLRLGIEVDGGYHKPEIDKKKNDAMKYWGITLLRFPNWMVLNDIDYVIGIIRQTCLLIEKK
jgi:very-short-patch-repair endonuclease